MGSPVVHFEILGKSGPKLQEFYKKLFDWKIDANNPMRYGLVEKEEGGIGGGIAVPENGIPGVTIYVEVEDLEAHLAKAEKLGGRIVQQITVIPDFVTFAMFSDPDGNIIGLSKAGREYR